MAVVRKKRVGVVMVDSFALFLLSGTKKGGTGFDVATDLSFRARRLAGFAPHCPGAGLSPPRRDYVRHNGGHSCAAQTLSDTTLAPVSEYVRQPATPFGEAASPATGLPFWQLE